MFTPPAAASILGAVPFAVKGGNLDSEKKVGQPARKDTIAK